MFQAGGSTTGAILIKQKYAPGFVQAVYLNNELMRHFPAPVDSGGDTAYRWLAHNDVNSAVEIFTENQAQPNIGQQSWAQCAVDYVHMRGMLQFTGHARDAMRSNYVNGIEEETVQLRMQIEDLWTTTWMGSTYGLEVAVDSTSTYAGVTRGSATWFEAYESAVSAIVGYTNLMTMYRTLKDNDRGANPRLILCPWNQKERIYNINGQPAIRNVDDANLAPGFDGQRFANCDIAGIGDMTDTVILMLDMTPGKWAHLVHRNWEVKEMAPSGDSDIYQLSYAGALVDRDPMKDGKLTSCTA